MYWGMTNGPTSLRRLMICITYESAGPGWKVGLEPRTFRTSPSQTRLGTQRQSRQTLNSIHHLSNFILNTEQGKDRLPRVTVSRCPWRSPQNSNVFKAPGSGYSQGLAGQQGLRNNILLRHITLLGVRFLLKTRLLFMACCTVRNSHQRWRKPSAYMMPETQ